MIYLFPKTVYNCKQATLLSIKKEEGKITLIETMKLRYHLLFCPPCRRFIDQWKLINESASRPDRSIEAPLFKLSEESKERIKRSLQL